MANSHAVPTQSTQSNLLRHAMRGNAVFSAVTGVIALLFSGALSNLTGIQPAWMFVALGIGLLLYAADLAWVTSRPRLDPRFGWMAVILDLIWVVGSVILLLTDALAMTTAGNWLVAIIADIVLVFAVVQWLGIRRLRQA